MVKLNNKNNNRNKQSNYISISYNIMELIFENTVKSKKKVYKKRVNPHAITYENFEKFNLDLKTYKITDLKEAARQCCVKITGTKPTLIDRIATKYHKIRKTIIIQKLYRGWLVRSIFKSKGPALNNRGICNNDTDCCSLEPLEDIDFFDFYSYKDVSGFVYGFNLTSLIEIYKRKRNIKNPYNRDTFSKEQVRKVIKMYNGNFIINPSYRNDNEPLKIANSSSERRRYTPTSLRQARLNQQPRNTMNTNLSHPHRSANMSYLQRSSRMLRMELNDLQTDNENPSVERNAIVSNLITRIDTDINRHYNNLLENLPSDVIGRYNQLIDRQRDTTINERTRQLFLEIDSLGNYTNESWFNRLSIDEYRHLIRFLYEIWENRGLTHQLKSKISPFKWPFDHIYERGPVEENIENIKNDVLTACELITFTGSDTDSRKIGAMHVLSALTLVSRDARNAVPWLYESVFQIRMNRINPIPY